MYVSRERRSSVQAMQFSNGLSNPIGLWLGHIMFDAAKVVIISTVVIIVYAAAASHQFHGLGFLVIINLSPRLELVVSNSRTVVHSGSIWDNCGSFRILRFLVRFFPTRCICDGGRISICHLYCELNLSLCIR